MKQQEITIAGKIVHVGYCYATEIAYKELANEDITDFMKEVGEALSDNRMPDVKKVVYLLIAGVMAYYQWKEDDAPVKTSDVMSEATPTEMGSALAAMLNLRAQFYSIPADGQKPKKGKGKGKN